MKAFNPLIPLDADNSGFPAAFFEICVHSPEEGIRYTAVLTAHNPFGNTVNTCLPHDRFTAVTMSSATLTPRHYDTPGKGDICTVDTRKAAEKEKR